MVLTSDPNLARRDLAKNRAFFELLGIPVADDTIGQNSTEADYCRGGVNYSTFAGFSLWLHQMQLQLAGCTWIKGLLAKLGIIVDEVDDAFFDGNHVDYRYAIPQLETDSNGESPLAIFYEAIVRDFLPSDTYANLLKSEQATEEAAFTALKEFLETLAYPTRTQGAAYGLAAFLGILLLVKTAQAIMNFRTASKDGYQKLPDLPTTGDQGRVASSLPPLADKPRIKKAALIGKGSLGFSPTNSKVK